MRRSLSKKNCSAWNRCQCAVTIVVCVIQALKVLKVFLTLEQVCWPDVNSYVENSFLLFILFMALATIFEGESTVSWIESWINEDVENKSILTYPVTLISFSSIKYFRSHQKEENSESFSIHFVFFLLFLVMNKSKSKTNNGKRGREKTLGKWKCEKGRKNSKTVFFLFPHFLVNLFVFFCDEFMKFN